MSSYLDRSSGGRNRFCWTHVLAAISFCSPIYFVAGSSAQSVAQYCKDVYGPNSELTLFDRNDGFGFRCQVGAAVFDVNMDELCKQQFGLSHRATVLDRNDAFSSRCVTTPADAPLANVAADIDPAFMQIVRSPFSGGVTEIAEVGRIVRGIARLPNIQFRDLASRPVAAEVSRAAIMVCLAPKQEEYIYQWNKRLLDTADAVQQLGFEKAETDAGNNPADYTIEEPDRSQLAIAWSMVSNTIEKEVLPPPPSPPFEPNLSDLNTAPPPPKLNGSKAQLLQDVTNALSGAPKTAGVTAMIGRLRGHRVWQHVAEPIVLTKLRDVVIGSIREDIFRQSIISLAPSLPRSIKPNSERLLTGPGGRMRLIVSYYKPFEIPVLHFYWRFVLENNLLDQRDRDFLGRLPGGNVVSAEQNARSLVNDLEAAWRRKLNQNALITFAANAMTAARDAAEPSRAAVVTSFIQSNYPATPTLQPEGRAFLIGEATRFAQRALMDATLDLQTVEFAVLESQRKLISPFSPDFQGSTLFVEPDQTNAVEIFQNEIRTTPTFRGVDLRFQTDRELVLRFAALNPVLAPFLLRWFRQASALKNNFDFTLSLNRLPDLRRANQQLAAAELETAMDDLSEGRKLQQDWWEIERIVREGATDYQFGNVTIREDAVVERTIVAKGDQIARGDEIATVRPLFEHQIKMVLPADVTLSFGTPYNVTFDCGDQLAVSPTQRRVLLGLPEPQMKSLRAALGTAQNRLRNALRFDATLVSAPTATGAPWTLRVHLPKGQRQFTVALDAATAAAASAAGFEKIDAPAGSRIIFDAGVIDVAGTCQATLDFASDAAKQLALEEAKWRRTAGP